MSKVSYSDHGVEISAGLMRIDGEAIPLHKVDGVGIEAGGSNAGRWRFAFWAGVVGVALGVGEIYASGWVVHKGAAFWIVVGIALAVLASRKQASLGRVVAVVIRTASREHVVLETLDTNQANGVRDELAAAIQSGLSLRPQA